MAYQESTDKLDQAFQELIQEVANEYEGEQAVDVSPLHDPLNPDMSEGHQDWYEYYMHHLGQSTPQRPNTPVMPQWGMTPRPRPNSGSVPLWGGTIGGNNR